MYKSHIRRTVFFGVLGLIVALAIASLSPKVYEGRLEMLLGNESANRNTPSSLTPDVESIVMRGSNQGAQTERQLLSSQSVFYQAFSRVAERRGQSNLVENWVDYYRMYDIEMARTTNQQVDAGVALILARSHDPVFAADVANEIPIVYNEVKRRQAEEGVSEGLRYLDVQVPVAWTNLDDAARKYQQFKEKVGVADLVQATRDESQAKAALNQNVQGLAAQVDAIVAEIRSQKSLLRTLPKEQMEARMDANPQLQGFEARLADLKIQRETLLGTYLPDSPNVRNVDEAIRAVMQKAAAEKKKGLAEQSRTTRTNVARQLVEQNLAVNESRLSSLQAQLASIRKSYAEQTAVVDKMPANEIELRRLERELGILDNQYQKLKLQQQELVNRSKTGPRSAVVLNTAEVDRIPIAPQPSKFAIIGMTAGLIFGLIVTFLIEALGQRIASAEHAVALTGLHVAAIVSRQQGARNRGGIRALLDGKSRPLDAAKALAYAGLRQGTKRSAVFSPVRSNVRSAQFAVEYAASAARLGQRVLLVDADLYRAPISRRVEAPGKSNLADVLGGAEPQPTALDVPNLSFLSAGRTESGFDESWLAGLETLSQRFSAEYDLVVWSAPACLDAIDVLYFASVATDLFIVASAATTRTSELTSAQEMLAHVSHATVQLVLLDTTNEQAPVTSVSTRALAEPLPTD